MSSEKGPEKGPDYKATIRLPQTDFPFKADLHVREPQQLERWKEKQIYAAIQKKNEKRPEFRFHDGPPYANGAIHHGHMLNKTLKDITVKYRSMSGWRCDYIPGWDTHGLPIEHQVDKELGEKKHTLTAVQKRQACEAYAKKWIAIQKDGFIRLGVFGDWEHPYLTLNKDYEAAIIRTLAKFVDKGQVVRGLKPVHWSWAAETALAEAEVEYENVTSPSIFVKYPVRDGLPKALADFRGSDDAFTVIWTTTPWTLPASLAVSVLPEADYVLARVKNRQGKQECVLLAKALADGVVKTAGVELLATSPSVKGSALDKLVSEHPWIAFNERKIPTLLGAHVTLETGSGLVHTAPGHGPDDFVIGSKHGLPPYAPVDSKGFLTPDTGKYAGVHILKSSPGKPSANEVIVQDLEAAGRLLNGGADKLTHSYPHCWRTHTPAIFRATPQWFISMDHGDLRKRALAEIDRVKWIPAWGRDRIYNMIAGRPDWCISRQRVWGVPIPVLYCTKCHEPLLSGDFMRHVSQIFDKEGADAWWAREVKDLAPAGSKCAKCGGTELRKETDILDVWFESGVSFAGVYEKAPPRPNGLRTTDLYLEGSDQHRGWFHSSLLCSVGTEGRAPYETVLTHGFVVDGQGKKISKSKGNYVDAQKVIDQSGAEIIRLWVAAEDYRDDIRLSDVILQQLTEAHRKFRNTLRYIAGNLGDFDPNAHASRTGDAAKSEDFDPLDRYALHESEQLSRRVRKAYEGYEYHQVVHALNELCSEMSTFYLDVLKDRLYIDKADAPQRRSAQAALWNIAIDLVRLAAPIYVFTAEEAYHFLPKKNGMPSSVHLFDMPGDRPGYVAETLAAEYETLGAVRDVALKALEEERQKKLIGKGAEAWVTVKADQKSLPALEKYEAELAAYFLVSEVTLDAAAHPNVEVKVQKARGQRCARCWLYRQEVGSSVAHPALCARCESVVK